MNGPRFTSDNLQISLFNLFKCKLCGSYMDFSFKTPHHIDYFKEKREVESLFTKPIRTALLNCGEKCNYFFFACQGNEDFDIIKEYVSLHNMCLLEVNHKTWESKLKIGFLEEGSGVVLEKKYDAMIKISSRNQVENTVLKLLDLNSFKQVENKIKLYNIIK